MEDIPTMQFSLFLMTSIMMASFMMVSLMACHRTLFERHNWEIGEKNPYDDQNRNPFLNHFLLFSL
jgi:hypothetical protein